MNWLLEEDIDFLITGKKGVLYLSAFNFTYQRILFLNNVNLNATIDIQLFDPFVMYMYLCFQVYIYLIKLSFSKSDCDYICRKEVKR